MVALLLRAPFLVVVFVAALTAACSGSSSPAGDARVGPTVRSDPALERPFRVCSGERSCSVEVEEVLEPDGEAGAVGDRADGQQDARG